MPKAVPGESVAYAWGVALLAAAVCGAWLRGRERVAAEVLGQSVTHELRQKMFDRLLAVSPGYLRNRRRGATIVRFVGDLQAIRRWVSLGAARLVVSGTTLLVCTIALAWLAPVLGALVGLVLVAFSAIVMLFAQPLEQANRDVRRHRGQLANFVTEQVAAQEVTRLHRRQRAERRRLERRSRRLGSMLIERARYLGRLDAATYAATALLTASLIALADLARTRAFSPDAIVATLVVVALLSPSLRELARVFEYRQAATVALDRIADFFGWPRANAGRSGIALREPRGDIEYDRVWLSEREPAFTHRIASGEHVALTGDNGVGKSTLLAVTAGLLEPQRGTIRIGNQLLVAASRESVHRHIALVSLELPLVRASLLRNLIYHRNAVADGALERVIGLCGLEPIIARLEHGLESRIAEGGRNLSQGERQRVALARALMSAPSVLLLDEIDAHLDADSRDALIRVIREFNGTVLAVTHDATLLDAFDRQIHLGSPARLDSDPAQPKTHPDRGSVVPLRR